MWNDQEVKVFRELIFNAEVEGVKLRQDCVVVLHKRSVYIYSYPEFEIVGQIETFGAQRPIWGLSTSDTNFVLAIPSREEGRLIVKKALKGNVDPETIRAHRQSRVSNLAVSPDGRLLACVNARGKRVKIFDVNSRNCIRVLRRSFKVKETHEMLFNMK